MNELFFSKAVEATAHIFVQCTCGFSVLEPTQYVKMLYSYVHRRLSAANVALLSL